MIFFHIENHIPANNKTERKMIMPDEKSYIQATEDYYNRMSDVEFIQEFERIHKDD